VAAVKSTFEGATAVRPNPLITAVSSVVTVLGLLTCLAAIELGPELLVGGLLLLGLGWVALVAGRSTPALGLRSREPIAAAREGLYEGERLIVPREQVRAALVGRHYALGDVLLLLRDSDAVFVHVDESQTARRLQRALRLDPTERAAEVKFRLSYPIRLLAGGVLMALLLVTLRSRLLFVVAPVAIFLVTRLATRLVVGDDGLGLRTLWRERFVPYHDIQSVQVRTRGNSGRQTDGLGVALRSGRHVTLARSDVLHRRFGLDRSDRPLIDRANDALERYRARSSRAPVLPLALSVSPSGAPLERVRALTHAEPGSDVYRRTAVDVEALRVAVDEPTLPPRVRAEAAIMLGAAGDADDLERLRRAAERSACRPLRELYKAVADGAREVELAWVLGRVS